MMRRAGVALGAAATALSFSRRHVDCETLSEPRETPFPTPSMMDLWAGRMAGAKEQIGDRTDNPFFRVYTSTGESTTLDAVVAAMLPAAVVLVGETHDDPVAHQLELYMLVQAAQGLAGLQRGVALSLEMFEVDVQPQLDEFLLGHIQEKDLHRDARPWSNYHADYRMLLEFAKDAQFRVIAANAPRRYVSAVGKQGRSALEAFPAASRAFFAPLPYPEPSAAYVAHFQEEMLPAQHSEVPAAAAAAPALDTPGGERGLPPRSEGCPYIGFKAQDPSMLDPIVLWDATMAHQISQALSAVPERLVYHVCGSFHCQSRLGIVEMLEHYKPGCKAVVVAIYPDEDFEAFDREAYLGKADFIILTDDKVRQRKQEQLLQQMSRPAAPPAQKVSPT